MTLAGENTGECGRYGGLEQEVEMKSYTKSQSRKRNRERERERKKRALVFSSFLSSGSVEAEADPRQQELVCAQLCSAPST